jgi:hypothetical protein
MKWEGDGFNINGVFVDDFATIRSITTTQKLKNEFEALYSVDLDQV